MNKRNPKCIVLLLLFLLAMLLAIPHSSPVQAAAPKISRTKAILVKGKQLKLKVTGTKKKAKWSSSRKKVAAVTQKGVVKAKSKGTARITAKIGKKKLICRVTVKNQSGSREKPKLSEASISISVGKFKTLKILGTKKKVSWYSTDKSVAAVSSGGIVYGVGPGACRIYAEIPGKYFMCFVSVFGKSESTLVPTVTQTPIPSQTETITPSPVVSTTPIPQPTQSITPTLRPTTTIAPIPRPTSIATPTPTPVRTPTPTIFHTPTPRPTLIQTPTPSPGGEFDEAAAKNSLTYNSYVTDNGVVVIVKNNYRYTMSLHMDCLYYNSRNTLIGKNSDYCFALEPGREAALFALNPYDGNYNDVEYSRHAVEFRCEETSAMGNAGKISCQADYGADNLMVTAKNMGQRVETTSIAVLFYKNGRVIGYGIHYAEINSPLSTDYLQYDFPYDSEYNSIVPDNYKVFVNSSYRYEWQ